MGRRKRSSRVLDCVLLVDKPSGLTSFDVVARVRKALGVSKVGHTGTLDPMATGLLVICIGQGTKLVNLLTGAQKSYDAVAKLGVSTDTYDAEGTVTGTDAESLVESVTLAQLDEAAGAFRGVIQQRPPAFSAIKIDGKRAYAMARKGEAVEIPCRDVTIERLVLTGLEGGELAFETTVSKGTYIRSLAVDLAAAVGLKAHLVSLRRGSVGQFKLAEAQTLEAICSDPEAAVRGALTLADAVSFLPTLHLEGEALADVEQGRSHVFGGAPGLYRALLSGVLRALIEIDETGRGRVSRGFPVQPGDKTVDASLGLR